MISTSSLTVWAESNPIGVGEGVLADGTYEVSSRYMDYPRNQSSGITASVGASVTNGCNCVVFRMDDLQDFFVRDVQVIMMDEFTQRGEFLSIGPIFNDFGNGVNNTVRDTAIAGVNSGLFELFHHGWNHTDFTTFSLANQTNQLQLGQDKAETIFGANLTNFIPPFNEYNNDTLDALVATGFEMISSEGVVDPDPDFVADGASDIKDSRGLYHLPSDVKFINFGVEPPARISNNEILDDIETGIATRGYAVVTLHAQDHAELNSTGHVQNVQNVTLMNDLRAIIDGVNLKNYPIRTFNQVVAFSGTLSIGNVTQVEGNSGTSDFVFTVTRSDTTGAMSVDYTVVDGTATVGDSDYNTIPDGTLAFTDGGVLTKTITVPVVGDSTEEPHETFNVNLSNCVGCNIVDAQGVGTITNDETTVSINNVTKAEGNSGITDFVFNVTRSNNISSLSVDYSTADNSATQPSDYIPISSTLNFGNGGVLTKTITVSVVGDNEEESNETFFVNLSNCVGCTIESQGIGTIKSECETLPESGNWIITNSCILESDFISPANILIQNGSVLTIPTGVSLSILSGNNLTVLSGGGILIESNGTLIIIS